MPAEHSTREEDKGEEFGQKTVGLRSRDKGPGNTGQKWSERVTGGRPGGAQAAEKWRVQGRRDQELQLFLFHKAGRKGLCMRMERLELLRFAHSPVDRLSK